jgi:hypothetical protein
MGLMVSLWWDQGRLDKLKPVLVAATEQGTGIVDSARSALALVCIDLDEPDEARTHVAQIVAGGLTGGARGLGWSVTLAMLAEVCARLGDTGAVTELTTALAPYTGQLIIVGTGFGCLGAADRYLGMLAAVGGQHGEGEAERLFETALALEQSVGSTPLASRTRVAQARALLRSGDADDVRRATQLLDAAAQTAERLGMAGLMHEIDTLR